MRAFSPIIRPIARQMLWLGGLCQAQRLSRSRSPCQARGFPRLALSLALLSLVALNLVALPARAEIRVVDDHGEALTLAAPAKRIVALAPHLVEDAFAAGAGAQLVGVIAGSDYPPAARELPRVGSYRGIPLEAVVSAQPDLVLAWGSGTPDALVRQLQALGIPVYRSEPRRLADIAGNLRDIGLLSGHPAAGERAAARFERALLESRQRLTPAPRVFYQLGQAPLTTLADGQIVTRVIRHCGGEPLFADAPVLVPEIGWEALLLAQPQVIVAAARDDAWQAFWAGHEALPAVAAGTLYSLDPDAISRPGPRLAQAARQLCADLADAAARLASPSPGQRQAR